MANCGLPPLFEIGGGGLECRESARDPGICPELDVIEPEEGRVPCGMDKSELLPSN
jgi:hypothetical protein